MEYTPRLVDGLLERLLGEFPAILLVGPRACGKTTTATRLARTVVRLDRAPEAAAYAADADAALRLLSGPVLLDEWQLVPDLLGAVKRAVDTGSSPGRFILAGSVSSELEGWSGPATGRILRVEMSSLTVGEQFGRSEKPGFLERVVVGDDLIVSDAPDLPGYLQLALKGGFPEPALRLSGEGGQRWLRTYLAQLTSRDENGGVGSGYDSDKLGAYVHALALNSAGVVSESTLFEAAHINRATANSYERLLRRLHLLDVVPAWSVNRMKRLVRSPKRYLTDSGLIAGALDVDLAAVMRDGNLIGRLLDTFVAAQLRPERELTSPRPRIHHLRSQQGRHEIDLVIEIGGDRVVAIEVKASAAPKPDAARHLAWLRDSLGERFVAGLVLHTGPGTWKMGDRLTAAPISSIWSA